MSISKIICKNPNVLAKIAAMVLFNVQTIAEKRGRCLPGKVVLLLPWTISI
jgi:hypothetical protein